MYSLNVALPGEVVRLAQSFHPVLGAAARMTPTLLVKRLDTGSSTRPVVEKRVRRVLGATDPFSVTVTHVDAFERPTTGSGTVLYLAVDSPTLFELHETLCDVVAPADGVEAGDYTPHITIGRTDDADLVERVCDRSIESVTWTATTVEFYDADTNSSRGQVRLDDAT